MATVLAMGCKEHQIDWVTHLSHVEYTYNNSASAATGLASNEVHIIRLPSLPLAVFDRSYGGARQSLDHDCLAYCDPVPERQHHAYELVREQPALPVARANGRNSTFSDPLPCDILILSNWINPPSTLHPTVSTVACPRSRARDLPHQR